MLRTHRGSGSRERRGSGRWSSGSGGASVCVCIQDSRQACGRLGSWKRRWRGACVGRGVCKHSRTGVWGRLSLQIQTVGHLPFSSRDVYESVVLCLAFGKKTQLGCQWKAFPRLPPCPPHLRTIMIVILSILTATHASPIGLPSPPLVSPDQLQTHGPYCRHPIGCRSLGDIIRNCFFTISLCIWVSIHPNIPSPDERWPALARRRAGLMLLALFVPEAVIAWAARQRLEAKRLAREHKGEF